MFAFRAFDALRDQPRWLRVAIGVIIFGNSVSLVLLGVLLVLALAALD